MCLCSAGPVQYTWVAARDTGLVTLPEAKDSVVRNQGSEEAAADWARSYT